MAKAWWRHQQERLAAQQAQQTEEAAKLKSQESTTMSTPPVTPPVTPPEDIGQAVEAVVSDVQSDITATQGAVTGAIDPLWIQARAEYDQLAPAAQGRIHQLLNDLEALGTALPSLHTFFGAK